MIWAALLAGLLGVLLLADALGPALLRGWWAVRRGAARRRGDLPPAPDALADLLDADDRAMYRELGLVRVQGGRRDGPPGAPHHATLAGASYAYLVAPHRPVVAYLPQTGRPIAEYRMPRPDPDGRERVPADADVAASVLLLRDDEERLLAVSAPEQPGRTRARDRLVRDLWRLRRWEGARATGPGPARDAAGGPPAPGWTGGGR